MKKDSVELIGPAGRAWVEPEKVELRLSEGWKRIPAKKEAKPKRTRHGSGDD